MKWTRIARSKPDAAATKIHPEDSTRLSVKVPLNKTPPAEWQWAFQQAFNVIVKGNMLPPELQGQVVWLSPRDFEVEDYMHHLDERIAAANEWFEQNALPKLTPQEKSEADETARRLSEAREKLSKL